MFLVIYNLFGELIDVTLFFRVPYLGDIPCYTLMKAITSAKLNCVSARNSRFASPKILQRGFDGDLYRTAGQCASFRATFLSPPIVHPGEEEAILGGSKLRRLVLETSILFTSGRLSKKRRLRVGSRYASAFMRNADEPALWMQPPAAPTFR